MRFVSSIVAVLALGGMASNAHALFIEDTTTFSATGVDSGSVLEGYGWGAVNELSGPKLTLSGLKFDYVTWTHKFDLPSNVSVDSAILTVFLRDDEKSDGVELAVGYAESGQWDLGLIETASYAYNIAVGALLDGSFTITVASLLGDFFIDRSVLRINYTPVASVPEPAMLSLLGLGLVGAAIGCRRRLTKR